jgi:hypothetical protein
MLDVRINTLNIIIEHRKCWLNVDWEILVHFSIDVMSQDVEIREEKTGGK